MGIEKLDRGRCPFRQGCGHTGCGRAHFILAKRVFP